MGIMISGKSYDPKANNVWPHPSPGLTVHGAVYSEAIHPLNQLLDLRTEMFIENLLVITYFHSVSENGNFCQVPL